MNNHITACLDGTATEKFDNHVFKCSNKNEHVVKELSFKGVLSDLRQLLENGSPLKMMKNAFYSTLKALFLFKIYNFLS